MLSALVLSAALAPQSRDIQALPEKPVTVTVRATTVGKAVAVIGRATGTTLEVDDTLGREVVVLRVREVPADQLLQRLATVLLGRWEDDGGKWRLVSDPELEAKALRSAKDRRLAYADRALSSAQRIIGQTAPWSRQEAGILTDDVASWLRSPLPAQTPEQRRVRDLAECALAYRTPGTRAAVKAVALLAREQIAKAFDERVVFSDRPNSMQNRLPSGIAPIVNRWIEEQNEWSNAVEEKLQTSDKGAPVGGLSDLAVSEYKEALTRTKRVSGPPVKTLLVLSRREGGMSAQLAVSGGDGGIILQGYCLVPDSSSTTPVVAGTNRRIGFSEEACALSKSLSRFAATRPPLPAGLLQKLLRPEADDPLSFGATDVVLGLADDPDSNVVAYLPDALFEKTLKLGLTGGTSVAGWQRENRASDGVESHESANWLVVSPRYPLTARRNRTERPSMGKLLRRVVVDQRFSLTDLVDFKSSNLSLSRFGLADPVMSALENGTYQRICRNEDDALQILARIGESRRSALSKGNAVSLRSLPLDLQRFLMGRLLQKDTLSKGRGHGTQAPYDDQQGQGDAAVKPRSSGDEGRRNPRGLSPSGYGYLEDEPTELLSEGFPMGSTVWLEVKRQDTVFARSSNGRTRRDPTDYSIERLAHALARKQTATELAILGEVDLFSPGWKSPIYVHIQLSPEWAETLCLYEDSFCGKDLMVGFAALPSDLREQVIKRAAELAKEESTTGTSQSGDGPTKP